MVQLGSAVTAGALTFNSAGFHVTGDGTTGSNILTLGGAAAVQVNNTGTSTISAIIAGSNGLNLSSSTTGTLLLSGANSYTGTNTITSGTLSIFADANLGDAANDITFDGTTATTAALRFNAPVVLNAGRTINLNNSGAGVATISSAGTASQVILGKITGAGALTIANAGTTYLLNATNDYTGILWSQTGTVSTYAMTTGVGNGNILLGSGTSTGGFQWATGTTGALNLTNRSIELAGTTGGGTIDSASNVAANSITIANNLAFTAVASGNKTLTLTGVNAGTNTFAGNITNNGASTTALTKSGLSLWQLTGTGNNYTGAIAMNQGVLRVVNASGLGGNGSMSFAGGSVAPLLEIRSDVAPTGIRNITSNSANNATIFVDHEATGGNTTTGQTITFGTVAQANNSAAISFVGNHGYGVALGLNTLAASNGTTNTITTYTITNLLGSPGLTGYSVGSAEQIAIAGFDESGTNTGGVQQTLNGWGNFTINGPISNTSTRPVNIIKSGAGVLTYAPTLLTGWNTGTLTLSGGTTRITGSVATAGATVTFGGGLVELRNNTSTNFGFNTNGVTTASTLVVDRAIGGSAVNQTATIGTFRASATLNVVGDHGYNLTTGPVTAVGGNIGTLANYLGAPGYTGYTGGTITLGNGTSAVTTTTTGAAVLALTGFGDFAFSGDIALAGATTSLQIAKGNLGVVNFSTASASWTGASSLLNTTLGTTRIDASVASIGSARIGVAGGLTEIRSNTDTAWSGNNMLFQTASGTLVAAPQIGSSTTGKTVTLGALSVGTTGFNYFLDTNHNYGITFNSAATSAVAAQSLLNIGNGTVTFAGGITSTGAAVWTLGGNGNFAVTGNLTAATTAITKGGQGTLTLSGAANTFGGNLILNTGVLRVNSALGAGTGTITLLGNQPSWVGLDLRNNASMDNSSHPLIRTYGAVINADNNGSGTNGVMTLGGGMSLQDNGWSIVATGANGYSLKFGGATPVNVGSAGTAVAVTAWNYIPSTSGNGNMEFTNGITFVNNTVTGQLTLGGTGDYSIGGALASTSATLATTLTKSGLGTVTLNGNSSSSWNTSTTVNVYTSTNGITRATVAGALGGGNARVNLNSGVLDLRNDIGFTLTNPITVGASNSCINVDRAIGGSGTAQTQTLSGVSLGAFTLFARGGNDYSLNTGTTSITTTAASIINNIGGSGTLTIPSLTGSNTAVTLSGSGSTTISAAIIGTGAITKSGTGTVTLTHPTGGANTTGNLTINAGKLVADYGAGSTNTIFTTTNTLGLSGGTLEVKGRTDGTATAQTLGNVTVNAGGGGITITPQGGGTTTLTTGTLAATAAGSSLLVTGSATGLVKFNSAMNTAATRGRNVVFYNGSAYDWATNTGANSNTVALGSVSGFAGTGTDSLDSNLTGNGSLSAAFTTNSLKLSSSGAGQALALGGGTQVLTLTNGGLLFIGGNDYDITATATTAGIKSATATNSDLVISQYGAGTLNIKAPVRQGAGTSTLTIAGTGVVTLGDATLGADLNTYTGTTFVNGGTLKLVNATRLGTTVNQALTINGGTFDINGNNIGIGAVTAGYAGTITNSGSATTLTVGNNNTAVSILGTVSGALGVTKTGTGALTLGDLNGMSTLSFTGDLTVNGVASAATLNVPLADSASSKISLGTAVNTDTVTLTYGGNTNMVLANRQVDLSGQSNVTLTASGVNGANGTPGVIVINSNVLTSGTGAKTLTLTGNTGALSPGGAFVSGITGTGSVATINQINGDIGNASGGGALTLTIAGSGGWSLGGNNSFTGGVNISGTGIVRGTSANAFGGSANAINWTGAAQLDLRSDSSLNYGNAITWGAAALKINVDRAPGGSGYSQIMTLGTVTEGTVGQTMTVSNQVGVGGNNNGSNPINNYGLRLAGLVLNGATGTTTITNAMGNDGAATFAVPSTGAGVVGALVIDSVSTGTSLGAKTLVVTNPANSAGVTIISGDIVQGSGTTLALSYTGGGTFTLGGPSMTSATIYSGGLTIDGTGTVPASNSVVRLASQYSLGGSSNLITAKKGTLEIRNDSSVNYGNAITMDGTGNFQIAVGEAINGSGGNGNTFTFGLLSQNTTARTLVIGGIANNVNGTQATSNSSSGASVTFSGVNTNITGSVITNNLLLPGLLNLGTIGNTTANTNILTLSGTGSVTTVNEITDGSGGGKVGINSNITSGILDLTRMTAASNFSGGLTLSNGTTRVINGTGAASASIGAAANKIIFSGSVLELRSDVNVTYSNPMELLATGTALPALGSGINVGQLANGSGTTTGITFTLGTLTATASGKTIAFNGIGGSQVVAASLASSGDSVTLGGVDLNGTNGGNTTINNNLPLPGMLNLGNVTSSTSGAATLTAGGSGVTTVGDVTDGSGTVALAYTGTGILDLSRMTATTNYSGGFTQNGTGTTRVTNAFAFGAASGIALKNGNIEIRSDTNFTYTGAINWNADASVGLFVGELGTGTTTGIGKTFNFGALTITTANAKTFTIGGINGTSASSGDSVIVNGVTFGAGNLNNTITNNLSVPGTLALGNIAGNATTTATLTIGGNGFTTAGDVVNGGGGGTAALTYSGNGVLQLSPTTGTSLSFSGGLNLTGNGALRVVNPTGVTTLNIGAAASVIALTGGTGNTGTLDIRTDGNLSVANPITVATNSVAINVDQATNGNLSKMVTFDGATTTLNTTAKALTLTSGSNYGMAFTNGFNVLINGYTIANNASGTVNLGAINYAHTVANGALTISGSGYTTVGNITGSTVAAALAYSGTGFLDLTGNAGATNPISSLTLSGAGGIALVNTPTNLGAAGSTINMNGGTLQIRNDGSGSNGAISFTNPLVFNATATNILDVGNKGSAANVNNTVVFGSYTVSGASANTLTVNGSNGYEVSFASMALPSSTGQTTTLVANAPVTIVGDVTNQMSGFTSGNFDTLVLDGVAGGTINGAINDATGGSLAAGGVTRITKQGTGTWILNGTNLNTGITTVNNGTLRINGSTDAAVVTTVNGSATQGLRGNIGGTGTIAGNVTLATNGATSYGLGAALNPGTVGAVGTLTIGGTLTTNSFTNLNFDLGAVDTAGGAFNDLVAAGTLPVISGVTQVNINFLAAPSLGNLYTLINGYTGTLASPANLDLNPVFTGAATIYAGVLQNNSGMLQLLITGPTPTAAYWAGAIDGTWNTTGGGMTTNWRTDATSNTDTNALPSTITDVFFYTTTPAAGNLTTTLGQNFSIKTLNFGAASTSAVSIAGSTLTITPGSSATGITMDAAAGNVSISSGVALGAAQTWTNNSTTNALTVSGVISGAGALTVANGTVNITQQANTFTGDITVDGGTTILSIVGNAGGTYTSSNPLGNTPLAGTFKTVTLTNGGTFSLASQNYNVNVTTTNLGAGQVFMIGTGGGKFDVASGSTFTIDDGSTTGTASTAYELQGSGNLTKSGPGTLTLRNQNSYSGTITVTGGLLQSSGTTIASGSAGIVIQSGAALSLAGFAVTDTETVTISGTGLAASPAGAITNNTGTASYAGGVILAANSSIGGPGTALTLSGIIDDASGGYSLTKVGTNTTTLSNTANTFSGALSVNGGTLSLASLANSGAGSNGTGAIIFNNTAAATLTYTGSGTGTMAGRGISLLGSAGVTINSSGAGALSFNGSNTNSITANTTLTLGGTYVGSSNVMAGDLADNGASVLSLTKAGATRWALSGTNNYSGTTTVTAGQLQILGPQALPAGSALSFGGGTLEYRDDASGIIDRTTNNITLTAGTTNTIDVGNNGGATTNSVVQFGTLASGTFTLNITGANGYSVSIGAATLTGNLTLNPTTASVSVASITNGSGNRNVILSGASAGNFVGQLTTGTGTVTQNGGSAWTMTGANTNTGAIAIQNGSIRVAGGNDRLNASGGAVTLGSGANTGVLIIGGNADGTTTAGSQRSQQLNQTAAASILAISGTATNNRVVGGADGGTSAGTPANNSLLNLNISSGRTNTYGGLIGWDGVGSVGFQNNINLQKSGGGTLVLSADLSNWTGTGSGGDLAADATRPELILSGGVLRLTGTAVLNMVLRNTGGIIDDQGFTQGANFFLVTTGGLITLNAATDTFAGAGITASSTGVVALNFNNTTLADYNNSAMYLGAVGARIFSGGTLAAGSGSTYRFGGGAPWNAVASSTVGGSGGNLRVTATNAVTGPNNIIIGDNDSYNGGSGLFGSNSSVEFTSSQNYTGTTTLAGGTLIVSNTNQLGNPTTVAGSIILDGGIFRYSGITTDISNRLTIDSGGTIDTNGQNVTFASAIGNSDTGTSDATSHPTTNAVGGLTKIGAGTLTLSTTAKTYAGTTTVSGGTLQLNRQTSSLASTSALTFGGSGTFRFDNTGASGALSQTMGDLSFTVGDGVILSQRTAAQSTNLTFASLTARTPGATGNFTVGGTGSSASVNKVIFTSAPATGTMLDPGLYFGGTNFASYDAGGFVRALATSDANSASVAAGATMGAVSGKDVFLNGAITAQTDLSVNSLNITGGFGITLGSGQTLTVASGGLLKQATDATITGGTVATAGELVARVTANTLTIASAITSGTGVAGNVALTKSGAGTLTLTTGTNAVNGLVVINGGTLSIDAISRLTGSTGLVLDGGTFLFTGDASYNSATQSALTLGLNGGTIRMSSGTADRTFGNGNVAFIGLGARTLTLNGVDSRRKVFAFNLGDNGGPTSLIIAGAGDSTVVELNGANTYTGTTTISRGILRLASTGALPGGIGGVTLTSANTGGGNLIFAATGTLPTNNRAVLELNATSGDFYRAVGTGFDQVSWTGHGGFSVSDSTTRIVNLGGAGAQLTWNSGGFVPTGSALQFGQSAANVGFAGTIDFQNAVELGGAARTVDVANGTQAVDATMGGNITGTSGSGGLIKQGAGALTLSGTNNTGALTVSVTGGTLHFTSTSAVLGASGNITVTGGTSAIGVGGSTNPLSVIGSRIVTSSTGGLALATNSSATLDFGAFTALRLTAYNPANAVTYFSGGITPNGTTYRFGGQAFTLAAAGPATTLALSAQNILTDVRSVDVAPGNLTILQSQNYSGGTVVNTVLAGNTSIVGIGSDAAFGSGTVTVGGANTVSFGTVNGDRVIANRIIDAQTGTVSFVVGANLASDGVSNNASQGALTYIGGLDLGARAASSVLHSRTGHAALFLGDIFNTTNGVQLNNSTQGLFSFLSTAANGGVSKNYSGATTLADNTNLYIDGNGSLGSGTSGVTLGNSTLASQPGTGTMTLTDRTITVTTDKDPRFMVYSGGNLTLGGPINTGTSTGGRAITKFGAGTLTLQGPNGTWGNTTGQTHTLVINAGKVVLDSANFTAAADRFLSTDASSLPLTFGAASGTLGGGGTLEMVQVASNANALTQAFTGTLTINQGAHTIQVTNNNTTQAATLNLGATFTRAALNGGTLNFVSTTVGGTNTIGSSNVGANGIIGGWATFNGVDWATGSGTEISAFAGYTTLTAASNDSTLNFRLTTGSVALSTANASLNSLKLVGSAAGTNVTLNGTNPLTSGGILFDNTGGTVGTPFNSTISGGTQLGATGSELIVHTAGTGVGKLTLNGVVDGSGNALTKSGSGTLVLAGANTYTGALTINAGTVEYSNATSGQNLGSPTAAAANIVLNGGTLSYTASGSNTLPFGVTLNSQSAINVGNAAGILLFNPTSFGITGVASTTTSGVSATTGILQKTGAGALTLGGGLSNANLGVQVVQGTLNLSKTGTFLAVGESTNASGMPYAALIVNSGASAVITGAGTDQVGDASSVVVQGTGFLDVNGSGSTSVAESFDGLAGNGIVKNTGASAFTLTLGANNSSGISAYTVGAAQAGVNATGLNHFAGVIQDNIALTKTGSGIQILSGLNTYTGLTTISAGTLRLGIANALPSGAGKSNVLVIGNNTGIGAGASNLIAPGTFDLGGFNQAINGLDSTTGGFVTNNPTVSWTGTAWVGASSANTLTVGNANANGDFNGVIMDGYSVGGDSTTATPLAYFGSIALTKTGAGTQVLSGTAANTYSGLTTVSTGTLSLNKTAGVNAIVGDGVSSKVTVDILINGGTLRLLADNQIADSVFINLTSGVFNRNGKTETIYQFTNSGGTYLGGRVGTFTVTDPTWSGGTNHILGPDIYGTVSNTYPSAALTISAGTNIIHGDEGSGLGSGSVEVLMAAANVGLEFAGNSSPSLTLSSDDVAAGILFLSSDLSFTGTAGTASILNGNKLQDNGNSTWTDLGSLGTNAGTVEMGTTTRTFTVANGTAGVDMLIGARINSSGAGLFKAGAGTLALSGANTYTGATTINAGTLQLGNSGTTGSLSPGSGITNNGTLTFNRSNALVQGTDFSNSISGGGDVVQAGSGTTTLSSTSNSYSGGTTVNGGTLALTGTLSGTNAVTVNTGGTLLLNSSANADNIIGTVTNGGGFATDFSGSTSYTSNSGTLKVDDTQTGRINTFASLSLSGASILDFGAGNGNALLFNGGANSFLGTLQVWNWSGSVYNLGANDTGTFGDSQDRFLFTNAVSGWDLTQISFFSGEGIGFLGNGAQVQFGTQYEIVPVPEPATTALIGAVALCALIGYRERRRFFGIRSRPARG